MTKPDAVLNLEEWQVNEILPDDPLLTCLILLTKYYNNPFSAEALKAGLPVDKDKLSADLFIRAAKRAGLTAQIVDRSIININKQLLPAVLLLKDNSASILLSLNDFGQATVIYPESGGGVTEVNIQDLNENYTGQVIYLQQDFQFGARTEEITVPKTEHWFWSVMWRSVPIYSEVLVAALLINLFALAMPLFSMNVYDRVVPNDSTGTLWVLAIGVMVVFIFDFLLRLIRGYFIDMAGKNVDQQLSANIFEQVLGIKMAARPNSVGAFANTVQGFEFFREFITSSTITILVDLPFSLLFILIITILGGVLALIPLLMLPVVFIAGYLLQLPLREVAKEANKLAAEKQATLIETLAGMETIKGESAEGLMQKRWERIVNAASKTGMRLRLYANASVNFAVFAQQFCYIAVIILGVYKISQGQLTVGALIACSIISSRALAPMAQVASLLTRYYQSMTAMESITKVMELPIERPSNKKLLHRPKLKGDIEFRHVSFAYPNQKINAVNDISLKITAGEHVAIIGRIGSGKTTISKLLLGFYQPIEGSILFDGTEQQQIDPAQLRSHIGYVPQDVVLFYGSVKENIVIGSPHVSDIAILRAAKIANVERFVSQNPQGFDMQVGERGTLLSGGQRQCIAIARAILDDPPILIMDEPSNDMDDLTEAQLKANLAAYSKDKTLILITHKASMLALVDRLILMDGGRLIADGPKEEVIKALSSGKINVPTQK